MKGLATKIEDLENTLLSACDFDSEINEFRV